MVITPETKPATFRATVPRLPVADVTATLEFYVGKLGFSPLYRFGDEAGVGLEKIIVRFCEGDPIGHEDFSIYFEITGTDEIFDRYNAEGVEVVFPPSDQPWGSRDFCIRDPNGYHLVFGDFRDQSSREQPSPVMLKAIATMTAGDLPGLRNLLETNPDLTQCRAPVSYRDDRKGTLLHLLMDYPDGDHPASVVELARVLTDSGAEVDSLDGDGEGSTPLQLLMAISEPLAHGVDLTELLLQRGASATKVSSDFGMDAFTTALLAGRTECAAAMFERDYPPDFPWAGAGLGNMKIVRSFFGEGSATALPPEQRADRLGEEAQGRMNCAFLVAAINGQTEVVDYLLDKGMDVNMQPPGSDFAGIGATALHWAVRFGRQMTVERLVARGASLRSRDDVFQLTPAGWAGWFGHHEIKQWLTTQVQSSN